MENEKDTGKALDCECIARKIVKLLYENKITYRESEEVMEYVRCRLWEQCVQDCD